LPRDYDIISIKAPTHSENGCVGRIWEIGCQYVENSLPISNPETVIAFRQGVANVIITEQVLSNSKFFCSVPNEP